MPACFVGSRRPTQNVGGTIPVGWDPRLNKKEKSELSTCVHLPLAPDCGYRVASCFQGRFMPSPERWTVSDCVNCEPWQTFPSLHSFFQEFCHNPTGSNTARTQLSHFMLAIVKP